MSSPGDALSQLQAKDKEIDALKAKLHEYQIEEPVFKQLYALKQDRDTWMRLKGDADVTISKLQTNIRRFRRELNNPLASPEFRQRLDEKWHKEIEPGLWQQIQDTTRRAEKAETRMKELQESNEVLLRRVVTEIERGDRARALCRELTAKVSPSGGGRESGHRGDKTGRTLASETPDAAVNPATPRCEVCDGRVDSHLPEPWPDSCDCKTGPTLHNLAVPKRKEAKT